MECEMEISMCYNWFLTVRGVGNRWSWR